MASNELLGVYLNDHLAGSAAGTELAGKLRDNHKGTDFGQAMAALHHDISQDKDTLEELMRHLEVERHPVKEAAGWMLEKLSWRPRPCRWGSRASWPCGWPSRRPRPATPAWPRPTSTA